MNKIGIKVDMILFLINIIGIIFFYRAGVFIYKGYINVIYFMNV